jgi:TetR/AcrR family transcriptional regulator, mexJK operon transcriptional repressor
MSEIDEEQLVGHFPSIPKQERAQRKRKALLESGRILFLSNGYENTTAKDIAAHANVATGTFYRYFSDKRQLLLSLLRDQIEKITPPVPGWMIDNPEYLLAKSLEKYDKYLMRLGLHRVLPELLPHDHELAEVLAHARLNVHKQMYDMLLTAFNEGLTWKDLDLDAVAWSILALVEKIPDKEVESGSKANYQELAKIICRMIFPPEILSQLKMKYPNNLRE